MIFIYGDEENFALMASYAASQKQMYALTQCNYATRGVGILGGGWRTQPTYSATTARANGGKTVATNGPFAETKEQFGGYYIIEVLNLDDAVKWATRYPTAQGGSIVVRPLGATPLAL